MKRLWKKPGEKIFDLKNLDRDVLLYKVLPFFMMEIMRKYFRLEVEGVENIPQKGPAIFVPNHSGYSGFDAMMLMHEIHKHSNLVPKVLAHHFWFLTKTTTIPAQKLGFIEANTANALRELKKKKLIILFPEGEYGNFKPTSEAYHLQEFKRGFVRIALKTQAPIIPTMVIGAEETHINLKTIKFTKYLRGTILPLPLNILPLPARWKIKFLKPIHLPFKPEKVNDSELIHDIAEDIQNILQEEINYELKNRESVFL